MIPTSELIDALVADAKPAQRLRSPVVRASGWLIFAVLVLTLVAVGQGVRPDFMLKLHQPVFVTSVAAALVTGVLAALASFIASIPGRSRRWLLLPWPALAVWVSTISYGCLTNWVSIGPDGMSLGETARCFATLVFTGIPLSLAMLVMLRHVARISPKPVAMTGSIAVSAMTAIALSVFHPLDATIMILVWNFGVAALFLGLSGLYSQRLFTLVARRG